MNTKFLAYFASLSLAALFAGVLVNAFELALFAVAVSALLILIAATDYAPRRHYSHAASLVGRTQRLALAA